VEPTPLISYQELITITLTALGVMLAALGIGIGVIAIVGYAGLKKGLHEMAKKHVEGAMAEKLKEYPSAAEIMETLQNQLIAQPAPNAVESASNTGVQQNSTMPGGKLGQPYPGEEPADDKHEHHD